MLLLQMHSVPKPDEKLRSRTFKEDIVQLTAAGPDKPFVWESAAIGRPKVWLRREFNESDLGRKLLGLLA